MKRTLIFLSLLFCLHSSGQADSIAPSTSTPILAVSSVSISTTTVEISSTALPAERVIHGIHLTASAAGSKKYRLKLDKMFADTIINAVVVDIKEEGGEVYVPGVKAAERCGAYVRAIPDLESWLADLKKREIYTVARVVVFKDDHMPRHNKSMAVHTAQGDLWFDRHKITWFDPFSHDAWKYNILIALQASKVGFDEIQFDYIRFPTDGDLSLMHFSQPRTKTTAPRALAGFLHEAAQVLHPLGVKISIDVFGLTTSVNSGMGIGQHMNSMAAQVDYVCPMTYPSHYAKGEYGIPNPNDQPYRTLHLAMRDALKTLGPDGAHKLRPYLQDFSLKGRGIRYRAKEVRAQMQAAADLGVPSWTLWNANCHYTLDAIKTPIVPQNLSGPTTGQAPAKQRTLHSPTGKRS